jgi:hypothetical protein
MAVIQVNVRLAAASPLATESLLYLHICRDEVILQRCEAVSSRDISEPDIIAVLEKLGVVLHEAFKPS